MLALESQKCTVPSRPAHEDYRKFGLELDHAFVNARATGEAYAFGLMRRGNAPLAFAVISIARGLENAGSTHAVNRAGEIIFAVDAGIGRADRAQLFDKTLFVQPVLSDLQRFGVRSEEVGGDRLDC